MFEFDSAISTIYSNKKTRLFKGIFNSLTTFLFLSETLSKFKHRSSLIFSVALFPLQEDAGSLLVDLSSALSTVSTNQDDGEVVQAATPILEAASNILNVSSNVRTKQSPILLNSFFCSVLYGLYQTKCNMFFQKKVSDFLLTGINNVQTALLINKKLNGDPAIIDSGQISVYVNR